MPSPSPESGAPVHQDAIGVEHERTDAARASIGGRTTRPMVGSADPATEDAMGLLDGKKALIFGVANDHSIAWGIAKAFHEHGATVGFSSIESLVERRVRPLAESIGSTFVEPCDVQSDEQIRAVFEKWQASARRPRHPRPRPGVREARGPPGEVRGHVPGRVRAGARRLARTRWWRWSARRGRCSSAARR